MATKTMRFVVGTPDLHSLSWTMVVQSDDDGAEIYMMPREISTDYHISLHKSGKWHVRVGADEARKLGYEPEELTGPTWNRPAEIAPGVTLAVRMIVTRAAVSRTHAVKNATRCHFIPPPSDGMSVEISLPSWPKSPPRILGWADEEWVQRSWVGSQ